MEFKEIMADSMDENYYIIINAAIAFVFLILSFILAYIIKRSFKSSEGRIKNHVYYLLDISYTFFITLISIFPLLGMFGTVKALIEIDMKQDTSVIQQNFFSALTSTAWGIIFSIFFKIINSLCQPFIENQISKAKESLEL